MDENEVIADVSLRGLTSQEEFKLKHSLANENKNARPLGTPKEIAYILKKAKDSGNSNKDIANFLDAKYESSLTKINRHLRILEDLEPSLLEKVVYLNKKKDIKLLKDNQENIGYQQAYELSRFEQTDQIKIFEFLTKNKLSWTNTKSIKQLMKRADLSIDDAIEEILRRKGISEFEEIKLSYSLKDLSPKLFKLSQKSRNEILEKIAKEIIKHDFDEIHLGSTTLYLKLKSKSVSFSSAQKKEITMKIKQKIGDY